MVFDKTGERLTPTFSIKKGTRYQRRQAIVLALQPVVLDRHVPALDLAGFAQALAERAHHVRGHIGRPTANEPDHRHRRLLRADGKRPSGHAAEPCDEFAPSHLLSPR
jgi:hypothetical protein